ncbi:MAG: L-2-amino-thiazoline-4-carboxylic acid hydrolase, partial [Candidatus Heimdallarchaeota archaeon]
LIYNTFDSQQTAKYKTNIVDGNVEVVIRSCVFCDGCKDWDKQEFGKIYCEYIDTAILKGYNPNIKFQLESSLTHGDKSCIQRYIIKE